MNQGLGLQLLIFISLSIYFTFTVFFMKDIYIKVKGIDVKIDKVIEQVELKK